MTLKDVPSLARRNALQLLLLLTFILLVGVYWSVRYAGSAMEVDAMRVTRAAAGMQATGALLYHENYHAGFGFTAALAFLSEATGLPVQPIQLGSGLWLITVALAAYIAYREMLGRPGLALLAAFLLFIQPDFLFYVLRASHEKATWLYALLLLFLTARSYRFEGRLSRMVGFILLFYLLFFGLAATNTFFASSFITALAISFALGWLLSQLPKKREDAGVGYQPGRLLITALACLAIVYLVIEYIYPTAYSFYITLYSMVDRSSALFLGAQAAEPYRYVESAWLGPQAYLALTGIQWLINLVAFVFWGTGLWRLRAFKRGYWLLWLMYTGFGVQLAASIYVDYAGFLSANLQVRQFTPFALLSSAMAALALARLRERLPGSWGRMLRPAAAILAVVAAATAMLKVTNDPLLGNQWLFYTPAERQAFDWVDETLHERRIWTDVFTHLYDVAAFWKEYDWEPTNSYEYGYNEDPPPYVLITRLTRLRANRSGLMLPSTAGHNRVYDNGDAQIFYRQPATSYQR